MNYSHKGWEKKYNIKIKDHLEYKVACVMICPYHSCLKDTHWLNKSIFKQYIIIYNKCTL